MLSSADAASGFLTITQLSLVTKCSVTSEIGLGAASKRE